MSTFAAEIEILPPCNPEGAINDAEASPPEAKLVDRRGSIRYPVRHDLQYWLVDRGAGKLAGAGRTLDMSSTGIRFSTQVPIQLGRVVAVSVDWPARLEGTCLLKLVAAGRVVRTDGLRVAMRIRRYEFRIRGSGLAPSSNPPPIPIRIPRGQLSGAA